MTSLGTNWKFLERNAPGCKAAWERDVGLSSDLFHIGVSGSRQLGTYRASAYSRAWSTLPVAERKQFHYDLATRTWRAV